jgi:hypothetical protein
MPRVVNAFLDCVVYLYPTIEGATQRHAEGGAGFLVAERTGDGTFRGYVVTCWHCAEHSTAMGFNYKKVSRVTGGIVVEEKAGVLEVPSTSWIRHPRADVDLALAPITADLGERAWYLTRSMAVSPNLTHTDLAGTHLVSIGDELFMVGRYLRHQGDDANRPVARFGNISGFPADVRTDQGPREGFLVEYRSIPGFSGSPVFVYWLNEDDSWSQALLGVNFASFKSNVLGLGHLGEGFAGVIPAWHILALLDTPQAAAGPELNGDRIIG